MVCPMNVSVNIWSKLYSPSVNSRVTTNGCLNLIPESPKKETIDIMTEIRGLSRLSNLIVKPSVFLCTQPNYGVKSITGSWQRRQDFHQ